MIFPIQWSWQQLVFLLVAIAAIGLIIFSMMSLVVKVKEIEILEDEQGRSYRLMRRRRRFRWHHGIGGLIILSGAVSLLWLTFLMQTYLGLTGTIKVAQVHATQIQNADHQMEVEIIFYDQYGHASDPQTYIIGGDEWVLQGSIIEFPSWLNLLGLHAGYKLTRLFGEYNDGRQDSQPIFLNGGDDEFFKAARDKTLPIPLAQGYYGSAVIVPANGDTYDVYVSQDAVKAEPVD
jgi:hypothetical protein